MIQCEPMKKAGTVKVTFRVAEIPAESGALSVVGDFNDWQPGATPFERSADGGLQACMTLPVGERYAFRYLAEQGGWFNDDAADGYEHNGMGEENSILDLTEARTGAAQ